MALLTNRKFIHFNQKSSFDTALANEQIADWQIVFIKDARLIWTHNLLYSFDQRITDDIYHKLLALNEINVELVNQVDALQQTVYSFFLSGATIDRPDNMELGIAFFDTDLDKPIWWDGTKWIDSEGNPAGARHSGTTAQRPTGVKAGFMYYDTTIGKVLNYNGTSWIETGLTEAEVENIIRYNGKEVEEYNGTSSFPPTGEDGIIYVDISTTPPTYYTWDGTTYIPNSNALNQVDWDENDLTSSQYIKNKPSSLPASDVYDWAKAPTKPSYTASEVGLGNVDNTSDSTKKTNFTGSIALDNTGFVTGGAAYTALTGKADLVNGKVPSSQLPSYVDDVIDLIAITDTAPAICEEDDLYYNTTSNKIFKATAENTWSSTGEDPESGKIYINTGDNKTYRWSGSMMVVISETLALGTTSSTAYRGDYGNTAYSHASESKLSTAKTSGLYKFAATAQGHIADVTAVQKSDITNLGIPGSITAAAGEHIAEVGTPSVTDSTDSNGNTTLIFNYLKGAAGQNGSNGTNGKNLEFDWDGTSLGVRLQGESLYSYVNLKGDPGTNGINGTNGSNGTTPHIDSTTGNWFIGETNTGVKAQGPSGQNGTNGINGNDGAAAGFGTITATIDNNVGTPSITVTTTGENTAKNFAFGFKNLKGQPGTNGTDGTDGKSIKAVQRTSGTGAAGTTDTYTMYTDTAKTESVGTFSVYNGSNGTNGTNGTDGISPSVSVSAITNGHKISITDSTHDSLRPLEFNVMDGTATLEMKGASIDNTGATPVNVPGASGLVPAPAAGDHNKFLRGDGTWLIPTSVNTTPSIDSNVLTVDGTISTHFFSINSSIADVVVNPLPEAGCTTHIVFTTAASDILINIEHTSTKVCPAGEDPDPISVPSGGYAELDFLSDGTKVYVRGI